MGTEAGAPVFSSIRFVQKWHQVCFSNSNASQMEYLKILSRALTRSLQFDCSQQVHGLTLREATWCSLGSLGSIVNGDGCKPGFLDFSLQKRKSSSSL